MSVGRFARRSLPALTLVAVGLLAALALLRPVEAAPPDSRPWIYSQAAVHLGYQVYWWDDFNSAEPDPAVTGYDVEYRQMGAASWTTHTHSGTVRATEISNLTAGQMYQVRVRATNSDGAGPWYTLDLADAVVSYATVPNPPFPVFVEAGGGQATVTWTRPSHVGGQTLNGYVVRLYLEDTPTELRRITVSGATATSTVISGLTDGTAYEVDMFATYAPDDEGGRPSARAPFTASGAERSQTASATVKPTRLAITEGSSDTFTVVLSEDPGANVTVTLVKTHYAESAYGQPGHRWNLNAATASPATLTFTAGTSGNHATAQTVTVSGVQDDDCISEQLVILLLIVGGDAGYQAVGGSVIGVYVTVADDDPCGSSGTEGDLGRRSLLDIEREGGAIVLGYGAGTPPRDYSGLIAQVYGWRNDPCCVGNPEHVERWDRVLLALGETVADQTLEPMTASEAQTYADKGWTRWVAVTTALRELEAAKQSE